MEQNGLMDAFSRNLRAKIAETGRKHAEIARTLGLHERRFAHYVSGTREPDLTTLVKIAKALGTTPNQLLGLNDEGFGSPEQAELVDRLMLTAKEMDATDLEVTCVQAEALLALKKFKALKGEG